MERNSVEHYSAELLAKNSEKKCEKEGDGMTRQGRTAA
jgi:hypothetical protein